MDWMAGLPGDLWNAYRAGGFAMHPITACSVAVIATIVYKSAELARERGDAASLLGQVRSALLDGRITEAIEACGRSRGPLAATLLAGLLKHESSRDRVERAMRAAADREIARLEGGLGILAGVVGLAPLLGFLGTVAGMVTAFDAASKGAPAEIGQIAAGIAGSLRAAVWGLVVAAVAQPCHRFFAARVARVERQIETASDALLDTLSEVDRMAARSPVGA